MPRLIVSPIVISVLFVTPTHAASIALGQATADRVTAIIGQDAADVNASANIWLGAVYATTLYLNDGASWVPYTGGPFPIARSVTLSASQSVTVVDHIDISGLEGLQLYVGYGVDEQDMLTSPGKLAKIYTVTTPEEVPVMNAVWQPNLLDSFHLQLRGVLTTNVAATIYDIDLFDTSAAQIAQLKQQGHKIVCYFSAGSSENWRPDFASFLATDMGNPLQGWPGENWLDIRSDNVRSIMRTRMNLALDKGCDGIDPDNVDGYTNPTGFPLTAQDQLDYNRFLSSEAHSRGLAAGLKNDVGQLSDLAATFEFAVNEQCHESAECADYQAFTSLGKPVLNVEYQSRYVSNTDGAYDELCDSARAENLRTLVLPLLLDGSFRLSCD